MARELRVDSQGYFVGLREEIDDVMIDDAAYSDFFSEMSEEDEIVFGRDPLQRQEPPYGMTEVTLPSFRSRRTLIRPKK